MVDIALSLAGVGVLVLSIKMLLRPSPARPPVAGVDDGAAAPSALPPPPTHHGILETLVDKAPIIAWRRDASGTPDWVDGSIAGKAGTVTADAVATMISARVAAAPAGASALPIEKSRMEVAVPGADPVPLHVTEVQAGDGTFVGYAVDATMAASAERTLSRFVQTVTETFAHLTVGLAIFDRNRTLAMFNPALVEMWGVEAAWLACRPSLQDVIERLRASRRIPEVEDYHQWRKRLLGLFENPEQADYEEIWHLDNGSTIRVIARPHPHGSLAFVFDDVSEQMKLEQRYRHSIELRRATLDGVDEGIAVFGPNGLLQFVNRAFHDIWGTDDGAIHQQLHARDVIQLCRAATVETEAWERLAAFTTGDSVRRQWSTRLTLGSGQVLSLRVASLPDGASMVVFSDITDSERIVLALRERNEALEAAEEMRAAVLDQISQRLRTPLNTIFGFGKLLSGRNADTLSPRQKEYASGILEAAGQLLDTVDGVTELAALHIEPLHDEGASHNVWGLLEATRGLLHKRAIEAGARLALADMPDGAEHLACDLPALRQIVFNLVADALHRASVGREIELGARAVEGGTLEIFTIERHGLAGAETPRAEFSGLTRSLIQRQTERAGGRFEIRAGADGRIGAICRFPGILGVIDAPAEPVAEDEEAELDLGLTVEDG